VRFDINQPNFNFFGTTTPRTLIPALNHDMVDNGTMSRILLVPPFEDFPDSCVPARIPPPEELVKDIADSYAVVPPNAGNLSNQVMIPNASVEPIPVMWDKEAFTEYEVVKRWQTQQSRKDEHIWVRFSEMTIKVAMIEAIARNPVSPIVTLEIFKMANDFCRWSFNYTEDLLVREISENETEASHKRILNFIRKQGDLGASSTQLAKSLQGMKARDRNEILQTLLEAGDIVEEVIKANGPGRDRRVYRVRAK
jgi:hypothetical protein